MRHSLKDALRRVDTLLKEGYNWVLDADIKGYFDTIPHDELMARVEEKIADGRVLKLIGQYLEQEIMETCQSWMPEQGTPQGAIISPLLSNIYLDPFDKLMSAKGYEMVRYADDFVIFCKTVSDASKALKLIREWMSEAKLTLHPEKTRIVDATQPGGFDFLGYHFERGYRWPGDRSRKKLKDKIRAKTKRTNGHSLKCMIADVNQSLEGWFEYFKHGNKHTYPRLDKWIRMRLRSILRKRQGKRGRGKGYDHLRWPNVYFAELGLFSLKAAWIEASQSARR